MKVLVRQYSKTPTEKMIDVNTAYLRGVVLEGNIDLPKISEAMGFCREYLGNAIGVGRMNKDHLIMLASMADFSYNKALAKKRRKKN